MQLSVHLENGQRVYFTDENLMEKLKNPKNTTLLAFFNLCESDDFARKLLYCEIPSYYVWKDNTFIRRKIGAKVERLKYKLFQILSSHCNRNCWK